MSVKVGQILYNENYCMNEFVWKMVDLVPNMEIFMTDICGTFEINEPFVKTWSKVFTAGQGTFFWNSGLFMLSVWTILVPGEPNWNQTSL